MKEKNLSLGVYLNNPLCLRYNASNKWIGQIGCKSGFCEFDSLEHGVRAAVMVLLKYVFTYHLFSIEAIIRRFAPNSDGNNTDIYIDVVTNHLKKRWFCLHSFDDRFKEMVFVMALVECGFKYHDYFVGCQFKSLVQKAMDEYLKQVLYPRFGSLDWQYIYNQCKITMIVVDYDNKVGKALNDFITGTFDEIPF